MINPVEYIYVAQILATKLYIPLLRSGSVLRSRLINRLTMGLHGKRALISAPAGFGKITLVTEWIVNNERKALESCRE